jgi:hypothetical protein
MGTGVVTLPLRLGLRVAGFVLRELGVLDDAQNERQREAPGASRETPPIRPRRPVVWDEPRRERVSKQPVLVPEVDESDAAEGPGAEIRVAKPWDGYSRMKATEIIARLGNASSEELAVVQLYEESHRRRKTVLQAARSRP